MPFGFRPGMRSALLSILLVIAVAPGYSQTPELRVKLKNGSTWQFPLESITKISFGTITGVNEGNRLQSLVKTFTLFQNYPNPFNPTTTIGYDLPKAGRVDVEIYDIQGRSVRRFEQEYQQAGFHQLSWDSRNQAGQIVATGLYFYRVQFEDHLLSKKMMLLK